MHCISINKIIEYVENVYCYLLLNKGHIWCFHLFNSNTFKFEMYNENKLCLWNSIPRGNNIGNSIISWNFHPWSQFNFH